MSREILVKYAAVYDEVSHLRAGISAALETHKQRSISIMRLLQTLDGATNTEIITAMEEDRENACIPAEAMDRMLTLIENSVRQLEQEELRVSNRFMNYERV